MRRLWRIGLILTVSAASVILVIFLLIHLVPQPPISEIEIARVAISIAAQNRADAYSGKLFSEAEVLYDSAMESWHKENESFIYFRDFEKVTMFAELSTIKANEASENATASRLNMKYKLAQKIDSLNNLISEINQLFYTYPLTYEIRDRISKGKLLLKEAEIANNDHQYLLADEKITDAGYLLTDSYNNANENLLAYFKSYPVWEKWIERTLGDSKKERAYAIIIDKFSRKCLIYFSGIKNYELKAELGTNWVGDKRRRGDKATPEGFYKITKKLEGSGTSYYKALLINYPNDEDKKKFQSDNKNGSLPASASIGNLIEIHGGGGKGVDWTDGCIALSNNEMDILFRLVKVGTPVTIVGSSVDLQKLINR